MNRSRFFSFTFLTQLGKSSSNFVAISSLVVKLLKKCWVRQRVGRPVYTQYRIVYKSQHNQFISLFIQADNMFRPVLGHHQVTNYVCSEEIIQLSHKIKYIELKFNEISLNFNHLNAELNPICHLLALLGAHPIFHLSGIRVNSIYLIL